MEWNKEVIQQSEFGKEISLKEEKIQIAKKIANIAKNGDVIGFGSGSTSFLTVLELEKRIKEEGLQIQGIPTSYEIKMLCSSLGIKTISLFEKRPDWCFDGTDEINKEGWLIKGRGAAMFKEKLNIKASCKTYILADSTKFVENLGEKFPIPIEIFPDSLYMVKEKLIKLGATDINLRLAKEKDGPVITENGNFILDTKFANIYENLEKEIKNITGVLESGLFIGYNIEVITK